MVLLLLLSPALAAPPVTTRTLEHRGARYHVVSLDLHQVRLDLVGQAEGAPHTFAELTEARPDLLAATNAGIFHTPERPVGLHIESGTQRSPVETADGQGNFFLKPNGVFWVDAAGAHIADAATLDIPDSARLATQSGPALVLQGGLHPAFDPASSNLKVRSAVGVSDPWTVHWVVSQDEVRFHNVATLLRDELGCRDALYLDGTISGVWTPDLPPPPEHDYASFLIAQARRPATGLQDGDVIFQRSTSEQASAIAAATGSDWTHVGLIRRIDGAPFVLEAVQPVQLTPLGDWIDRGVGGRYAVRRLAEAESAWSPAAIARLDALQQEWLGRPYDPRFGWGDDRLYCSELVHKAVQRATGVDLGPRRPVSSYDVADPLLRAAMEQRWGAVPDSLAVVAPSDLFEAAALIDVQP